jgi:hypothetical protein
MPSIEPQVRGTVNNVSTWILLDDKASASSFPQAGRRSSADPAVQQVYVRCVIVFFAVASRVLGKSARFRLYTGDEAHFLKMAGEDNARTLREIGVEIITIPLRHLTPEGYFGSFRNQFYIFDILNYIAQEGTEANHLVLDSDCLVIRPLDDLFHDVMQKSALTLDVQYGPEQEINGLSRKQMGGLYRELSGRPMPERPIYFGGEFFAATSRCIREMIPIAASAWQQCLARHAAGLPKFTEEAHLLSYLYYALGIETCTANRYSRRIWTGLHYRNGVPADRELAILHVPNEKRLGLKKLYHLFRDPGSWVNKGPTTEEWVRRVQKIVGVPRPSVWKLGEEFAVRVFERLSG